MLLSPTLLVCLLAPAQDARDDVYKLNQRSFKVPVRIDRDRRDEIEQVDLYVSTDQGKSWEKAGTLAPVEDSFRYTAPTEGVYWFAVQIVLKNKSKEPADSRKFEPALKVSVESAKKPDSGRAELLEEIRQLRAEVKRLNERLANLERMLQDKP